MRERGPMDGEAHVEELWATVDRLKKASEEASAEEVAAAAAVPRAEAAIAAAEARTARSTTAANVTTTTSTNNNSNRSSCHIFQLFVHQQPQCHRQRRTTTRQRGRRAAEKGSVRSVRLACRPRQ